MCGEVSDTLEQYYEHLRVHLDAPKVETEEEKKERILRTQKKKERQRESEEEREEREGR